MQQAAKYYSHNDVIKMHDAMDASAPVDQFKTEHHPQNQTKYIVQDKVNNINHWKNTDKVGDPEIR